MFEKASRQKLRFETSRGMVTTEDLWDMPLTGTTGFSLDGLAKRLNKAVKESADESFVVKKKRASAVLELKFEIVKRVIEVKLEDIERKEKAAENRVKKERILDIIADKEDDELKGESITKLKKMVKKL